MVSHLNFEIFSSLFLCVEDLILFKLFFVAVFGARVVTIFIPPPTAGFGKFCCCWSFSILDFNLFLIFSVKCSKGFLSSLISDTGSMMLLVVTEFVKGFLEEDDGDFCTSLGSLDFNLPCSTIGAGVSCNCLIVEDFSELAFGNFPGTAAS